MTEMTPIPRLPGWSRERPGDHRCGPLCDPPFHALLTIIDQGVTLAAYRAWLAQFPTVQVTTMRYAEYTLDWCLEGERTGLVIAWDPGWNAGLAPHSDMET